MNSPVAESALGGTLLFTALGLAVVMNPKTRRAGSAKNKAEAVAAFAGIGAVVGLAIGIVVKAVE